MGKMKLYELAKEMDVSSKELLEQAKALGIQIKSHLSSIEEDEVKKLKAHYEKKVTDKKEDKKTKKEVTHTQKKDNPVIIRREVIIEENKNENKVKENKNQENKNPFVQRNQKKEYNIVYRNKVEKPMTVSELFGLNKESNAKQEEKEEKKEEINNQPKEEKIENPKKQNVNQTTVPNTNQKPNQTNPLASRLMKEIDYYNQDSEKRRELMDYATRLEDERLIGERIGEKRGRKEGRKEGKIEGRKEERNRNARNIIIAFKANNAAPSFIFQFVKSAFKDDLTDKEIQQMIDEVEENE